MGPVALFSNYKLLLTILVTISIVKDMDKVKKLLKLLQKMIYSNHIYLINDFRSSNDYNDIGYSLYVFVIRYQKNLENAPPITVEIKLSEDIPASIYDYALVLTNTLVSISSDGQRHFDLI